MTDAETLQKLIELAWVNGWRGSIYDSKDDLDALDILISHDEDRIMFQHSFVQALCKAKWKTLNMTEDNGFDTWEEALRNLATSTNRLEYIAREFLG